MFKRIIKLLERVNADFNSLISDFDFIPDRSSIEMMCLSTLLMQSIIAVIVVDFRNQLPCHQNQALW